MVGQSNWIFLLLVLLMEGFNRGVSIYKYLNWPTVYLRYSLKLNVVAPDPIEPFVVDVLFEISLHIVLEETLLAKDVVHAQPPNFSVVLLSS